MMNKLTSEKLMNQFKEDICKLFKDEVQEIAGTISNENLWMLGSQTPEQAEVHTNNIAIYCEYLKALKSYAKCCDIDLDLKEDENDGE